MKENQRDHECIRFTVDEEANYQLSSLIGKHVKIKTISGSRRWYKKQYKWDVSVLFENVEMPPRERFTVEACEELRDVCSELIHTLKNNESVYLRVKGVNATGLDVKVMKGI